MKTAKRYAWLLAALLAAGPAIGNDEERSGARADAMEKSAPGLIERSVARLERAIARLEARLSGRGGSAMGGCEDMMGGGGMMEGMMGGGGMMGGSRPNEQWRSPGAGR